MRRRSIGTAAVIAALAWGLAACDETKSEPSELASASSPSVTETAGPPVTEVSTAGPAPSQLSDIVVAETSVDIGQDGTQEWLKVVLTDGELKKDEEPGPFQGEFYEGRFRLELTDSNGKRLLESEIVPFFGEDELMFPKGKFMISCADYNRDGQIDFTIGQYASSNGFAYRMYSIAPDGFHPLIQSLPNASSEYSVLFESSGEGSFMTRSYDNSQGKTIETIYAWDGETFAIARESAYDPSNDAHPLAEPSVYETNIGYRLFYDSRFLLNTGEVAAYGDNLVLPFSYRGPDPSRAYRTVALFDWRNRRTVKEIPITDAVAEDDYQAGSILTPYGLRNDELLYSSAKNVDGQLRFTVDALDLKTFATRTIADDIPKNTKDWYARNWFSPSANKVVFNTYHGGNLEVVDLATGGTKLFRDKYPHSWPFYKSMPSPDGKLFWYESEELRLIDLDEKIVAKVPIPKSLHDYPLVHWSPDGRYAAMEYDLDDSADHVLLADDAYDIAPQVVRVFDRKGKDVVKLTSNAAKGEYLEIVAWLPDTDSAIVHYFHLKHEATDSTRAQVVDSTYKTFSLKSKAFKPLAIAQNPDEMVHPELAAARTFHDHSYVIDRESRMLWIGQYPDQTLRSNDGDLYVVCALTGDSYKTSIQRYDVKTGEWRSRSIVPSLDRPILVGGELLMDKQSTFIDLAKLFDEV